MRLGKWSKKIDKGDWFLVYFLGSIIYFHRTEVRLNALEKKKD